MIKTPLVLEQLPTAAEFRDAVESLSPEQQRFCQAFRRMQLEGSVFAVAVILDEGLLSLCVPHSRLYGESL